MKKPDYSNIFCNEKCENKICNHHSSRKPKGGAFIVVCKEDIKDCKEKK